MNFNSIQLLTQQCIHCQSIMHHFVTFCKLHALLHVYWRAQ